MPGAVAEFWGCGLACFVVTGLERGVGLTTQQPGCAFRFFSAGADWRCLGRAKLETVRGGFSAANFKL